jgi:hypothetical protein
MITIPTETGTVELYRPIEAAAYCKVSVPTLNLWRREGWVPGSGCIAFGRGWAYTKEALDSAMRDRNNDRRWTEVRR